MRLLFLRAGFVVLPLVFAAWTGCSSSDSNNNAPPDGGDETPITPPPPPPPGDSGGDAGPKRDCTNDTQADGLTMHLECSGLYSDFASGTIAPTAKPYKPAVEFWSDGAVKTRWISIPTGTKIDISNFDQWSWPKGTMAWKQFVVNGKRVETRMFKKVDDAPSVNSWVRTTYIWTDDETDAVRNEQGKKIPIAGKPDYEIPSTGYCDECHFGHVEQLLGLDAVQLGIPGATGQTLAQLAADGWLNAAPPQTTLAIPEDPGIAAGKAIPALGWLNANCGTCHNPLTTAAASFTKPKFQIRGTQLLGDGGVTNATGLDPYTTGVCKCAARVNPDAGTAWWTIKAASTPESLASVLSGKRAIAPEQPTVQTQMPPLITHVVDTVGHQELDDWINALPACPGACVPVP
jgi:hypothetical protein